MSEWQTVQKSAYLSDFIELNKTLQQAVVNAVKDLENDPLALRGNTIKKMTGFTNVYRYRIGDFRLIYAVAQEAELIQLLAVGPRSSIYKRFDFPGWDAPETAVEFGPQLAARPAWMQHPEWFKPDKPEPTKTPLPRKLTPALLKKWYIPADYHEPLIRCLHEEDLVKLSEHKVPADILGRVMDGLYPAPVERIARQPDQVLLDPDDLLAYAEGTLTSFLLRLDEQQEPFTSWALAGPTLVKGGPGSGKSTVALYRLRNIVAHELENSGSVPSILFTTYTNALINSSESLLRQLLRDTLDLDPDAELPKDLRITTLHRTALWITHHSGQSPKIAGGEKQMQALDAARASLKPRAFGDMQKLAISASLQGLRDDYLLEEFDWVIEGQDCRTEDDYQQARRIGRGIPFSEKTRTAVWQLYTAYRRDLEARGLLTWGQVLQFALDQVRDGHFTQRWDYVVVDEAQDLTPTAVALCVELCHAPTGLFLTADANQSLYNRGFRWRNVHDDLQVQGRTRILKRNYRSTREIAQAAAQIVAQNGEADPDALQQDYVHSGAYPVIYAASGSEDQARWLARHIYDAAHELRLPLNSAVVLVHSSSLGESLAAALTQHGLPARFMSSRSFEMEDPHLKVTTLHAAKGLEFPIVAIAHVEAGRLPRDTNATEPDEIEAFLQAQRRLFYVGCTRAMRYLFITHDRQVPSRFLENLSDDYWMRL